MYWCAYPPFIFKSENWEYRTQAFIDKWEKAKVDRAEGVKQHILKVMTDPDNDKQRMEAAEIRKQIKVRLPAMTKRLDGKGLRLETWQLEEVIRDEIIDEEMEAETKRAHADMIEAAAIFQKEKYAKPCHACVFDWQMPSSNPVSRCPGKSGRPSKKPPTTWSGRRKRSVRR